MTCPRHRVTAGLPAALAVTLALGGQTAGQAPPDFDTHLRTLSPWLRIDALLSSPTVPDRRVTAPMAIGNTSQQTTARMASILFCLSTLP